MNRVGYGKHHLQASLFVTELTWKFVQKKHVNIDNKLITQEFFKIILHLLFTALETD